MSCAGCFLDIGDEDSIACTIDCCSKIYHAECTNKARLTETEIKCWACPECAAAAKKGGDNSQTPVRGPRDLDNITHRKKAQPQTLPAAGCTEDVADALQRLSAEVTLMRQSTDSMLQTINSRLDGLCEKISSYDLRLKSLEKIENENIILKAKVTDLQSRLDNQEQASLRNEVEVCGLEETAEESPYHLVLTTAVKLGIHLDDTDLVHVSRVGPKRPTTDPDTSDNSAFKQIKTLPRPLAVAFVRRAKRDEFLRQAKVRRNIKSGDIIGNRSGSKVYINERLTSRNRHLFRNARAFAKEHSYRYCWVRNGNIFIRKQDASHGSPANRIRSEEDLTELLGVPSEARSGGPGAGGT